ncbi:diadenylate cyclase CdaA [Lyngbya confervoides]|uniref:Diadenylate cyclase n=1 Tax=Lyngbya confervoides BDU141951 TaxID=1574623 RepID=A0ABD4T1C5_9CYAN|nr:diadenylate cyclase CdaA [Lyngbya confervoides]MCM1982196.1 diadenylate cyclase CdaA [Lyngbya confervoides BDU141951]
MEGLQQWVSDLIANQSLLLFLDIGLVLALTYMVLLVIAERRTLWMVRGFILLMLAAKASERLGLDLLFFLLSNLVTGSAVAMAVILQSEARRFLEQLGRGELFQLFKPKAYSLQESQSPVDKVVEAVKELSQNRTGALLILETSPTPMNERDFSVPGVKLNAELSKELIQTIFQTTTLLHDGALLIRGDRIAAAGVILPISDRLDASRQLGTRHRAAMGITERVDQCVCIVVSEETGSISLAEKGNLQRPLTSSKLKELLSSRLTSTLERDVVTPGFSSIFKSLHSQSVSLVQHLFNLSGFRKKT